MRRMSLIVLGLAVMSCSEAADEANVESEYDNKESYPEESGNNHENNIYAGSTNSGGIDNDDDITDDETYDEGLVENEWIKTSDEPTSTFSIDVDNASYTLMRSSIDAQGQLPNPASVRVEEYLNYFDYGYGVPNDGSPFAIHLDMAESKFGADLHLLRIGLQGKEIPLEDLKPTNLVFLVDVSGSMGADNKLPLVQESLRKLVETLRPTDRIAIVTYAADERVVLGSTEVAQSATILTAIDSLESGGSTHGEAGIVRAYEIAEAHRFEGGNNRVIICTDGDFNVGKTGDELVDYVESFRDRHISLTAVGFGRGNYNDYTMERLTARSNGNYFYVDQLSEAHRIFGDDITSTLEVIAADVKVQLEFDPTAVEEYRLVGYENRMLENDEFEDDTVDAGEVGPGHNVTAVYEVKLHPTPSTSNLADFRVRYKERFGQESLLVEKGIKNSQIVAFDDAPNDVQFAAAVIEFAEILRESKHTDGSTIDAVIQIATATALGDSARREFVALAESAKALLAGN